MKIVLSFLTLLVAGQCLGISTGELYEINAPGSVALIRSDEESRQIFLSAPIHFYTEKYDSIYVSFNWLDMK